MPNPINEDTVEYAAIGWFRDLGYEYAHGANVAPGEPTAERDSYRDVLLVGRLERALGRLNRHLPPAVRPQVFESVIGKLKKPGGVKLTERYKHIREMLIDGVDVEYRQGKKTVYEKVRLLDFDDPNANDWLVVNQFTVIDINPTSHAKTNRRPDLVIFVNGIPLSVLELKNPADEKATIHTAFRQLQTYKDDIGSLLCYASALVISDGVEARVGTLTAGWEWFTRWRTVDGDTLDPYGPHEQFRTLVEGVFRPAVFLDLLRYFVVVEEDGANVNVKLAAYHQYHAVNKAVERTLYATGQQGDQRVGVVWHTQGSGKSLSMLFYAGKVIRQPEMQNPTLVVMTDRNDLDDQLFDTFAGGKSLLRQDPVQAQDRDNLRELLSVASGGVVFTTIQKFRPDDSAQYPTLSERRNIIFITDEAHRSQYGFSARMVEDKTSGEARIAYGFAKYVRDALPNASFIGFTGTPIEQTDANTRQVFGDYIDIYDIQRAVDDGATVPIYYSGRLARLHIDDDLRDELDPEFDEITEGHGDETREKLKTKWTALEAMVGTQERLERVAEDIVTHFEERQTVLQGKAMIVAMSRRIAVDLYQVITALRPSWHDDRDEAGAIKVVMTGSAGDPSHYQPHIRSKKRRKDLAERFKDPDDPLKLVIVRDMWLTGFDAPVMHTMYVDKPMRGHGLMQAIARVNRVFRDKPGGLVVDYLGIATELQKAVQHYTAEGGRGLPAESQHEAVALMQTKFEDVQRMFHGFDYRAFFDGSPGERLGVIPAAMDHLLGLARDEPKKVFMNHVSALSKAFALSTPDDRALAIREEVAFFQAVRSAFAKATPSDGVATHDEMESAIRQLVSSAVASDDVIDIFSAAGLKTPDIGVLSDEFLEDVQHLPQKNLALEMLRKLLSDEIRSRSRKNVVQARSFEALLEESIRRYQNRTITASEVVVELIDLAREMRDANQRGEELGLDENELAFYDALAESESARDVMGDQQLAVIALDLVKKVKANVSIDWTVKESARAKMRVLVKRILRHYGYPPDLQDQAVKTVLEQAEALASEWVTL